MTIALEPVNDILFRIEAVGPTLDPILDSIACCVCCGSCGDE